MNMYFKVINEHIGKEYLFGTTDGYTLKYHTSVENGYVIFISRKITDGSELETIVPELYNALELKIEILSSKQEIVKTLKGRIQSYNFRSMRNRANGNFEPYEEIYISVFK